jgi:hypothetical protein
MSYTYNSTIETQAAGDAFFGSGELVAFLQGMNNKTSNDMALLVSSLNQNTELSSQDLLSIQTKLQNLTVAMEEESAIIKAVGDLLKSIVQHTG